MKKGVLTFTTALAKTLCYFFLVLSIQLYFESPLAVADILLIDLFKQLGSIAVQLAKQEINLLVGVDEEVQKLQGKLGMIKASWTMQRKDML